MRQIKPYLAGFCPEIWTFEEYVMIKPAPFAEIWRGPFLESAHLGHAVVCDETGQVVQAWGDPDLVVLPRSSSKTVSYTHLTLPTKA